MMMTTRPEDQPRTQGGGKLSSDPAKPWMAVRAGETTAEWSDRLCRTCYACGVEIHHGATLDLHQRTCDGKPPKDPGNWVQ